MRDVEWEPIEEEHLEEPKEGWMLGESKKRLIRISSWMLIVGLVPRIGDSCESKGLESLSFFLSFWDFILMCICVVLMEHYVKNCMRFAMCRMRELVVKYKAEKVCHEEMVKMPLVDLKVLERRWMRRFQHTVLTELLERVRDPSTMWASGAAIGERSLLTCHGQKEGKLDSYGSDVRNFDFGRERMRINVTIIRPRSEKDMYDKYLLADTLSNLQTAPEYEGKDYQQAGGVTKYPIGGSGQRRLLGINKSKLSKSSSGSAMRI
ncbi:hypothetical protein Tco_0193892 [Tanacetum coccineum]